MHSSLSRKRYKVGYTEDLNSIINYVKTSDKYVTIADVIQFCVDYELFIELYMNYPIIHDLINEQNQLLAIRKRKETDNNK